MIENAILDSTYCKNASNALELFVDNDDSGSCVKFLYHHQKMEYMIL